MKRGICLDCGQVEWLKGRGLGRKCWNLRFENGTLAERPALTYRQMDYWARQGYLRLPNPTPGTGTLRQWSPGEIVIARTMVRLKAAGLTVEAAHRVARAGGSVELAPGIRIEVDSLVEAGAS